MKKASLSILSILLLASCKQTDLSTKSKDVIKIVDLLNRENTIEKKQQRIVCIGAGALRLFSYIGDREDLCGVEDIDRDVCQNPFEDVSRPYYDINKEYYRKLESCGKGGPKNQSSEAEKIITCKPSLIISEYEDKKASDDLQNKVNCPVINIKYGKKSVFDDAIKASLSLLGKVLGKEEKAQSLISYIEESEAELKSKSSSNSPACYIGCLGNYGTQDIYSTSTSFPLFEVSNIKNVIPSSFSLENGKIEKENLLSLNPDIVFLDSAGISNFRQTYSKNKELFSSMDAFKKGNVYLEMPFNAYYTNLEIALTDAYYIASICYPEKYEGFSIEEKSEEITERFLGVSCYETIIKKAKLSYNGYQRILDIDSFLGV